MLLWRTGFVLVLAWVCLGTWCLDLFDYLVLIDFIDCLCIALFGKYFVWVLFGVFGTLRDSGFICRFNGCVFCCLGFAYMLVCLCILIVLFDSLRFMICTVWLFTFSSDVLFACLIYLSVCCVFLYCVEFTCEFVGFWFLFIWYY